MSINYIQPFMGLSSGLQTTQVSGAVGGWVELGRTTLGSASSNLEVGSLANKRYLMILHNQTGTAGTPAGSFRVGNGSVDTGSNYASRRSVNGASDATSVSSAWVDFQSGSPHFFTVAHMSNLSSKEKLGIYHSMGQNTAGAGNAPDRRETVTKWVNTSNVIDTYRMLNFSSGSYDTGSEVVVLGWDPADTHTNNFWEELANVDVTTGTSISTGTITAKKYLWVQAYLDSTAISYDWRFNSDSTTSYCGRHNNNGTEYTQINKNVMFENMGFGAHPHFINMFIINNSANEKLVTGHIVSQGTAGAGNAPNRAEFAYKWTNTSAQITDITMLNSTNVSTFKMKVWGAN